MSFRFARYAFANIVSSLYECVSNHLKNDLFHRRGQKMVPIHFCNYMHQGCNILAYIEIHLLPSFKLFAQTAQLNHFLHDCFAL